MKRDCAQNVGPQPYSPEPQACPAEEPDEGNERDREDDKQTPDRPLDEPPPVPIEDPPPPVTPGPYVAQEEKLCT